MGMISKRSIDVTEWSAFIPVITMITYTVFSRRVIEPIIFSTLLA